MTEALPEGTGGRPQLVAGPQVPMAEWPRCQSSVCSLRPSPRASSEHHPQRVLLFPHHRRVLSLPNALCAPRQYPPVCRQPDSSALSVHLPPFWSSGCSLVLIPSVEAGTGESLLGSCACLQEMRDPCWAFHQKNRVSCGPALGGCRHLPILPSGSCPCLFSHLSCAVM